MTDTEPTTVEPIEESCPCYKCTEPIYEDGEHGEVIVNNLHGKLRPCENCGRAKTEYVDRYTWGYYECWWCNDNDE